MLVIYGGVSRYSGDDINKFLWMVRIGGSTEKGQHIKEWDYYTPAGEFRVDSEGSPTLLNCLMYKLCYYNCTFNVQKCLYRCKQYYFNVSISLVAIFFQIKRPNGEKLGNSGYLIMILNSKYKFNEH